MKKLKSILGSVVIGVLMLFLGLFIRQPQINKLKKQVENLQKDNTRLLELSKKQHQDFANLLAQHKALKVYALKKKTKSKEGLHENLVFQYAMREYLELLLNRVRTSTKMAKEEITFFSAYENVINGKKLSTGDMVIIRDYIYGKYDSEIKQLKECDCTEIFKELQKQEF